MENNPKKSKAFIITFILILLLLLAGYYLYKNRSQIFDAKGSTSLSKIFSPLFGNSKDKGLEVITDNTGNTTETTTGTVIVDAEGNKIIQSEAGEDLKKGDVVYIAGFNANNKPIVMKALASDKNKSLVFGVASEDITKSTIGNIIIDGTLKGITTNRQEGTLWATGNQLYLSDKIAGGMTKNTPSNPAFVIPVGNVMTIDPTNGSVHVGNMSNLITQDANGNKVILVVAGEDIKKGDAVYVSGFTEDNKPIVMKALASDKNRSFVFGVAGQDITNGSTGNIIIDGTLSGIATNKKEGTLWATGNTLYLSDKVSGAMTKNAPIKPSYIVILGNVMRVDPINGSVHVGSLSSLITIDANGNKVIQSEAGENIKKGDVVYIAGFNANNKPIVMKALASDKNKSIVFGIAGENISKGSLGNIIIEGGLSGINTSIKEGTLWATGNQLYLSDKIAGGMTKNPPLKPSFIIPIGSVASVDRTNGSINIGNTSNLFVIDSNSALSYYSSALGSELLKYSTDAISSYWNSVFGNTNGVNSSALNNWNFGFGEFTLNPINIPTPTSPSIPSGPTIPSFKCKNGATNYPLCTKLPPCANGATNPTACTEFQTPGSTKVCDNGATNYPLCTELPPCANGATNPTACTEFQTPTTTDGNICKNGTNNYPDCTTIDGVCLDKTMTNPPLCNITALDPNACKVIEEEALTFTTQEQTDLSELLRKYYLIALNLKNAQDISNSYKQISEYKVLLNQVETLTNECFNEIDGVNSTYTGPKERYGNPWYNYTNRNTYTNENMVSTCKYVTSNDYTVPFCEPSVSRADSSTRPEKMNFWSIPAFNYSVNIKDFETILNIW